MGAISPPLVNTQTAPVVRSRSTGNISFSVTANEWTDTDPSGNASARDLDGVLSNCRVGDFVLARCQGYSAATATNVWQDFAIVVAGAVTHRFSEMYPGATAAGGLIGGFMTTGLLWSGMLAASYQLVAGDFEADGTVRIRHQHQNKSTTARNFSAATANRFVCEYQGPFR